MMTALGIDFGEARIGVAGGDRLGILASPLETVASQPRGVALQRLAEIARQRQASTVVIGLPIRQDGLEGTAAERVRLFAEALRPHLPAGATITFQDEYGTTLDAAAQLRAAGKKAAQQRAFIDQAAAVLILQAWLDARALEASAGDA
jgi:putative holliday junction resolvase